MRWVRFEAEGRAVYGLVEGDTVHEVHGDPFSTHSRSGKSFDLDSVKLLIPVVPPTFYAAGLNYREHVIVLANKRGEVPKLPKSADIGYRANNSLIAHGEAIVIPADATERIQYEGELVAVIGRQTKNVTEAEALSCVLGYTIGNDVSERSWQAEDTTMWRAKNTDTFAPMGPWIETDLDISSARTRVRVNGQQMIDFATGDMVFGIAAFISRMSRYVTLQPGDVIWMGTDGSGPYLKHGDTVEIEITGIGTLSNPVIRAGSASN